jgi:hypothetical protein
MLALPGMSKPKNIRLYAYVNQPYEVVRRALRDRPLELFQQATNSAATRAHSVAANLRVGVGSVEVGVRISIHVHGVREEEGVAGLSPVTRVKLGWEAATAPGFFPLMSAELSAWPLSASETQLEIEGLYEPPLGVVGTAIDAAVGHRIAEASVHRFLEDIVEQLRRTAPGAA